MTAQIYHASRHGDLDVNLECCSALLISSLFIATVDGSEILHQLIGMFPIVYKVLYIPGGAGFLPSTVSSLFNCSFAPPTSTHPLILPAPSFLLPWREENS